MKNIHILPTDKPSRIYLIKSNNKLGITSNNPEFTENFGSGTQNQHIYITSDEEIKEGDWCLDLMNNKIYVATKVVVHNLKSLEYEEYLKKIILTTDQDLIKDGVQAIDYDFIEWFVKNPSCESVEVSTYHVKSDISGKLHYKIIIPKEEPKQEWPKSTGDISVDYSIAESKAIQKCMQLDAEMAYKSLPKQEELDCPFDFTSRCTMGRCDCKTKQEIDMSKYTIGIDPYDEQETLEEVAQKYAEPYRCPATNENEYCKHDIISAFNKGAKWQQEQDKKLFSKKDIINALHSVELKDNKDYSKIYKGMKEWFELKNK